MKSIVILASGSGTLAQAIFDAIENKTLDCTVAGLICDRTDAPVILRAQNHHVPVHLHPMISDRQQWNKDLFTRLTSLNADRDSLESGASRTGTTIHWVDAGVDTGEIIAQQGIDITEGESEESLHERIKILERSLIVATIGTLLSMKEIGRS